jgi:hypothetical protein
VQCEHTYVTDEGNIKCFMMSGHLFILTLFVTELDVVLTAGGKL